MKFWISSRGQVKNYQLVLVEHLYKQRVSHIFIEEEAMCDWQQSKQHNSGKPLLFSGLSATKVLMMKRIFSLLLNALRNFNDSIFRLSYIPVFT